MASGAPVQPNGRQPGLGTFTVGLRSGPVIGPCLAFPVSLMSWPRLPAACWPQDKGGRAGGLWLRPPSDPFPKSAPVGQTWTHLPQLVHVVELPHGVPRSLTSRALTPRPIMSHVWAPSISSHTRTQRVHRMQRLWSRMKRSWVASTSQVGVQRRQARNGSGRAAGLVLQFTMVVGHADGTDVVALDEEKLDHLSLR